MRFNKTERELIRVLYHARRGMSLLELSRRSETSWITVRKYALNLVKREVIKKLPGKRPKFRFRYELLKKEVVK